MKIAVLGTGNVGETIALKLIELGHEVMIGSRSAQNGKAIAFVSKHPQQLSNGTFADAAAFGTVVFNCTAGVGSIEALQMAGESHLAGKIIIDLANPLDFSKGMPPTLTVVNNDSLGEQIQQAFPSAKVVKALNTIWCGLMVNPQMVNHGDHNIFICGNDEAAKKEVIALIVSFGWDEKNILDLGDIAKARGTEMYLPLWLSIFGEKKTGAFNIKIVG